MRKAPIRLFPLLGIAVIGIASLSYATPITIAPGTLTLPGGATLTLTNGEQLRLVYITANHYNNNSSNIATYNTDVNNEAGNLSIAALTGISWYAIGSTTSINAIQNVGTDGVAVYNLDGLEVASTDGTGAGGLFSGGTLLHPIDYNETGAFLSAYVNTGSTAIGTAYANYELGSTGGNSLLGNSGVTYSGWLSAALGSGPESLYGISDVITVSGADSSSAVPEPGTISLMMLGGMFLAGNVRKYRSQPASGTIPSTLA